MEPQAQHKSFTSLRFQKPLVKGWNEKRSVLLDLMEIDRSEHKNWSVRKYDSITSTY